MSEPVSTRHDWRLVAIRVGAGLAGLGCALLTMYTPPMWHGMELGGVFLGGAFYGGAR